MKIPVDVIEKMNAALDIIGRPRRILYNGMWLDTGCLEWSQTPSQADAWKGITTELVEAMNRFYSLESQSAVQTQLSLEPLERQFDAFFANEPEHIHSQFAEFKRKLAQANSPPPEPPKMPETGLAFQAASHLSCTVAGLLNEYSPDGAEATAHT